MARFTVKAWGKAGPAMGQDSSAALTIEDEVSNYLLLLFIFINSAMSVGKSREFKPFVGFIQLFPPTTPNELPPLRTINTESARTLALHKYENGNPHPPNFRQSS